MVTTPSCYGAVTHKGLTRADFWGGRQNSRKEAKEEQGAVAHLETQYRR